MAVHSIEAPIVDQEFDQDFADYGDAIASRPDHPASGGEINLGAFRGLAYALVIETTLVILGSAGWLLWHILR